MKKRKVKTTLEFESILNHYLTNNIPLAIMDDFYELNLRQRGFMLNRVYDYSSKEDSIGSIVNSNENLGVSEAYLLMTHNVPEESPVSYEEQKALFKEKEELEQKLKIIEQEVILEDLPYMKDINKEISELDPHDLDLAIKIHERFNDKIELDDDLNDKSNLVDEDEVRETIQKEYNIDDNRIDYLLELFAKYSGLLASKKEFVQKIARNNVSEYQKLKDKYNNLMDSIIKKNVKLANWVVRKYFKYVPAEMEEMQAYALEGLVIAVNTHDYKLGYRFSSLATVIIKHKIQRHFKLLTGITWNDYLCVCRYNQALSNYQEMMESDEIVSVYDLYNSNLFGFSMQELTKGEYFSNFLTLPFSNVIPIDPLDLRDRKHDMLKTMDDYTEEDNYEDDANNKLKLVYDNEDELDIAEINSLRANINEVLETLTEREQGVLRMRFGLDGDDPMTLEQVAAKFFVTRERVRQIEAKALRRLRHPSRANRINIYRDKNSHYYEESDLPYWVESLKPGSDESIFSLMLLDYIEDREFYKVKHLELARRYNISYYKNWYTGELNPSVNDHLLKFERIVAVLATYQTYTNIYDVKREVEEKTEIILPVDFYMCYLRNVAKISAKRL